MTVSSPLPSISDILGRLQQFRATVRDLIDRGQHLDHELTTRTHRVRYQRDEALRVAREQHDAACVRLEAHARERRGFLDRAFQQRQLRIQQAGERQRQRALAQLEAEAARRTFEIQRAQLEADRQRDAELQALKEAHELLLRQISEARSRHQELQVRACLLCTPWPTLSRLLAAPQPISAPPAPDGTIHTVAETAQLRFQEIEASLLRIRRLLVPVLLRYCPWWLGLLLTLVLPALLLFGVFRTPVPSAGSPSTVLWMVAACLWPLLHLAGYRWVRPRARQLAEQLAELAAWLDTAAEQAEQAYHARITAVQTAHARTIEGLNQKWRQLRDQTCRRQKELIDSIEERVTRAQQRLLHLHETRRQQLEQDVIHQRARLDAEFNRQQEALEASIRHQLERLHEVHAAGWEAIRTEWNRHIIPEHARFVEDAQSARACFPPWSDSSWADWHPPESFPHAAWFGHLVVTLSQFCELKNLADQGLSLPPPDALCLPLLLALPHEASIILETEGSEVGPAIATLNNLILRLLTVAPPGQVAFTILDPVGLGQNFAGLMHLADYEDRLIHGRIWTQSAQFEDRLGELNEHIEKVTQMYLRNDYANLTEYNLQAGRLSERYHFLVVAHFPVNFTDLAAKRLLSLAASGPRCGVYLLIHWDLRRAAPPELVPDELRKYARRVLIRSEGAFLVGADQEGIRLELEAPPPADLANDLLHRIGQSSRNAFHVETPFSEAAPRPERIWSSDATDEVRVPIGRTGAIKLQYLSLGQGTRQHGLIAGRTGSGKSTLFHVIITNLALWYSPDEVEFYLVDFKKGVEFKCYAAHRLPHARVIAIESDREFGLSVLQRVDEELRRRGDLFRRLGVLDLPGYRRLGCQEPLPRVLLLIDEFQEFFVEDDRIAQTAALLLDRIVRQGRAFGIHVLLGSQTLGGAYTLARSTMGQMNIRIALQCNEADALLILNEDNPAPRHLSRPGEAIYNDEGGAIQGNSPFQVVWLSENERDSWLQKIRQLAESSPERAHRFAAREPVVFEGNAPAHVESNRLLRSLLDAPFLQAVATPRIWLGEPNAIKGPTEVTFHRQSGNHLLIVGQRDEAALAMLALALIALAAQLPRSKAEFYVFDASPPDAPEIRFWERLLPRLPHPSKLVRPMQTEQTLQGLAAEVQKRTDLADSHAPELFLFIHRAQHHRKLRYDEEAAFAHDSDASQQHPGLIFDRILTQGASVGFHVLLTCDTYGNLTRQLSRKALGEFERRVLFQMNANDSASLIDSPQAHRLGLHRALLYHGQEGWMEIFRPYALPDTHWFESALEAVARLHASVPLMKP
ncbi:MAG: FtsK/SpoIIIE domain-containing protein [Limisphaera sp.]|nr:FtsK/SpoIIIE domain-containing protein [Limisphaera sp.]